MKLTKDDIGKKFRMSRYRIRVCPESDRYFLLLGIVSSGRLIGENALGDPETYSPDEDFEPYEEPKQKKRIDAAPAVIRRKYNDRFFITDSLFESLKEVADHLVSTLKLDHEIIKWPASWDPVKGVWFHEYEEK